MNLLNNNIYDGFTPLPSDLQGWNFKHYIFSELIRKTEPATIIEVGTWKGASCLKMAAICRDLNLTTKIYCVDTWLGSLEFWTDLKDTPERDLMLKNGYPQVYYQFLSNVVNAGLQEYIIPVPLPSVTAAQVLAHYNITADLIYIDGSHEYEDVKADLKNYLPLLSAEGIMFGDDYNWPFVKKAVDESLVHFKRIYNYWIND